MGGNHIEGELGKMVLDISVAYPQHLPEIPETSDLLHIIDSARDESLRRQFFPQDRFELTRSIGRFFGRGPNEELFLLPSAGLAVTSLLEFTAKEVPIVVPEGNYPLESFGIASSIGLEIHRYGKQQLPELVKMSESGLVVLVEYPRYEQGPEQAFHWLPDLVSLDLSKTVFLIDGVNSVYGDVKRVADENMLRRIAGYYPPLSRHIMHIESLSKLLPHGLIEGVAMVSMNRDEKLVDRYREFVTRTCYDVPSNPGLWVTHTLLHSKEFADYHKAVKRVIDSNFETVQEGLSPVVIRHDGALAWIRTPIEITRSGESVTNMLDRVGIKARHTGEFTSIEDSYLWIRLPLFRRHQEIKALVPELKSRLKQLE